MLERVRTLAYTAITSPRGDVVPLVRFGKRVAWAINSTLGFPLASEAELARRKDAERRLREGTAKAAAASFATPPVSIYYDAGRSHHERTRMVELFASHGVTARELDVAGDEAALSFVTREAKCTGEQLPVAFIGLKPYVGYESLVTANVAGELALLLKGKR